MTVNVAVEQLYRTIRDGDRIVIREDTMFGDYEKVTVRKAFSAALELTTGQRFSTITGMEMTTAGVGAHKLVALPQEGRMMTWKDADFAERALAYQRRLLEMAEEAKAIIRYALENNANETNPHYVDALETAADALKGWTV